MQPQLHMDECWVNLDSPSVGSYNRWAMEENLLGFRQNPYIQSVQFDGWLMQEEVNYVRPWRMNGLDSFNEHMSGGDGS